MVYTLQQYFSTAVPRHTSVPPSQVFRKKFSSFIYSRTCLIRHRLIRQFAQVATFLSVLAEFLSFAYILVRLIRHGLNCQFAQFVTSFSPLEAFCSTITSFAVSLLMLKQLVKKVWKFKKQRIFI